jgi:hypothetical protein
MNLYYKENFLRLMSFFVTFKNPCNPCHLWLISLLALLSSVQNLKSAVIGETCLGAALREGSSEAGSAVPNFSWRLCVRYFGCGSAAMSFLWFNFSGYV